MAYATAADMVTLYGAEDLAIVCAARGEPADTVDTDKVGAALDLASSEIDSYLRRHYVVPVRRPCSMLVQVCCQIARYRLFSNSATSTPTEQMGREHKDAITWLRAVNDGKVTLDHAVVSNTPGTFSWMAARPPVFGGGSGHF